MGDEIQITVIATGFLPAEESEELKAIKEGAQSQQRAQKQPNRNVQPARNDSKDLFTIPTFLNKED